MRKFPYGRATSIVLLIGGAALLGVPGSPLAALSTSVAEARAAGSNAVVLTNLWAFAQAAYKYTYTVDQKSGGDGNYNTIQDAIDAITTAGVNERWTVLIYAGEYDEAVELDSGEEYIDLVGVDRDAVIIAPASGDGVTLAGHNALRNLTIKPSSGHGVTVGSDCVLENLLVETSTAGKHGVWVTQESQHVAIDNCIIRSWRCQGLTIGPQCTDLAVRGCEVLGSVAGVRNSNQNDRILLEDCRIVGDNAVSGYVRP
ncbi:MAG: right-handed parallel beta-helix repeat-containing protein, partial [Phycisphaerae bacterium]|nr:right-handed parallel beta-helix repeat-containing protein [Phycisphaerae bacterium]